MRILIIGAGAIGLWLGARLIQAGHEVTLVARGRVAEALVTDGIRLVLAGEVTWIRDFTLATHIDAALPAGASYDAACLTMKAYDVAGAVDEMQVVGTAGRVALPARIICFQNGLGSEETAAARLGADRIIAGTITTPVSVLGPGMIEPGGSRRRGIGLARFEQGTKTDDKVTTNNPVNLSPPHLVTLSGIAAVFRQAGFNVCTYADYRSMLWSKVLVNMLGNATSAILDLPPAEVYADRRLFRLEYRAVCEALTVMHALGIGLVDLPGVALRWIVPWVVRLPMWVLQPALGRLIASGRGDKMPSLHLDLAAGRGRTEVGYLNGAVARYGQRLGIATPVNQVLTDVLEAITQGDLDWHEFRHRPERLLAEVARAG
jgi:2-dehydropantoate 2-reductase